MLITQRLFLEQRLRNPLSRNLYRLCVSMAAMHAQSAQIEGNFMMRAEDVQGLTIPEIRNRYAIPTETNSMDRMAVVTVKPGATIAYGPANPHPEWGEGGGTQFYLKRKSSTEPLQKSLYL